MTPADPPPDPLPDSRPADRPLRKDAQRSRRLVLDAAADLFARHGLEVGFDEIARAAGVGVGTVYRRFPDRQALVDALFSEKVDALLAGAAADLEIPDPWAAIVAFCERSIREGQRDRGLAQVLAGETQGLGRLDELRAGMGRLVDALVERAQHAGSVRADVDGVDLAVLTHLLSRVAVDEGEDFWRRYLALFLDALRAEPARRPLPVPPPTPAQFDEILHRL